MYNFHATAEGDDKHMYISGADPRFLQRGFIFIKMWGFTLLILSNFYYISHENEIIWSHCDQTMSFS